MISVILRNKLFLVSLCAIYPNYNIQHRLVFQQILIFSHKKTFGCGFQMAFSRLFKNFFFSREKSRGKVKYYIALVEH